MESARGRRLLRETSKPPYLEPKAKGTGNLGTWLKKDFHIKRDEGGGEARSGSG